MCHPDCTINFFITQYNKKVSPHTENETHVLSKSPCLRDLKAVATVLSISKSSIEDIVKYVAELRESIDSLASAMDETTLTLGEGNKKVEQSLAAIQQMNDQMDNISVSVDSIFNDIDTQTGVTKSLAKQIENIS